MAVVPDARRKPMATLAETINTALRAVGTATERQLRDLVAEFDGINLSGEERLGAVATSIAALAWTHHRRHKPVYLEAVKTWSLEVSAELQPGPPRLRGAADIQQVVEAAEALTQGVDGLIEMMHSGAVRTQHRLVTELAVVARLLGEYDANTIHLTLHCIAAAIEEPGFEPGEVVMVPLREAALPLRRDAALESLAPRGCA
jgi:hypothetical protein